MKLSTGPRGKTQHKGPGIPGAFFAAAKNRAIRLYLLPPAAAKGYRFYPLREPKPRSGFGFAEFALRANSWEACKRRALLAFSPVHGKMEAWKTG
jgi:hypothetical protein